MSLLRIKPVIAALVGLFLLAAVSCSSFKDEKKGNIIARVGDMSLSVEEVKKELPDNLSDDEKILFSEKYVEAWIKNQILYQNALRKGISLTDYQKKELRKLEESYIIRNYLNVQLSNNANPVSEKEIKEYYRKHKEDYLFTSKMYHLVQLILEERNKELFTDIRKSSNLLEVLKKYGLLSRPGEAVTNGDIGFVEVASLNPKIAKNLRYKKVGDITPPIKIDGKYFFLQLLEIKKPGDLKPLSLVEDEIKLLLEIRKRAEIEENLIKELRTDYVIETFFSKLKNEVIN